MADEIKLPPLPEPAYRLSFYGEGGQHDINKPGYSEDQVKSYATQAVEDYKAQQQQGPVYEMYRGELCYRSQEDDQSYGMLCPVHDLPNGTKLYTHPAPAQQPLIADPFTYIIQHLNSNPYALTKDDCITLIKKLRNRYSDYNIGAKP